MPFDIKNLQQRLISSAVIAPLALLAVYCGGWVYGLTATLIVVLGMGEWLRLADPHANRGVVVFAYTSLALTMALGAWQSPAFGAMLGAVFALVLFLLAARDHEGSAGWIALGMPYLAGFGLAMLFLRATSNGGMAQVYYLFATVWGTDIGAYAAGRLIGGPKLAPDISPNKTWAGFFGGMVLASAFGYAVAVVFGARQASVGIGLAVLLACTSQLGDLFESWLKRRADVKESGDLIPGHGGVLDRIDGLIFAAVFFSLFQIAVGQKIQWW